MGDAQNCRHNSTYEEIVENLQLRYGLSRRQARDRLAALKVKLIQSIHRQATEVTSLMEMAFPALANAERQAVVLKYFNRS